LINRLLFPLTRGAWLTIYVNMPEPLRRGAARNSQPVALQACLGIDQPHESQVIGAVLLADVILRVADLSDAIGCRGLLVHAESEQARVFYQHLIPEWDFRQSTPCTSFCSSRTFAIPLTASADLAPLSHCRNRGGTFL
jgi:hypothetical protein